MPDRSRVIEELLSGPQEDIARFFNWVATLQPDHSDRGHFIMDTRTTLRLGGDPASDIQMRGPSHVAGPLQKLLAEWRAAGSPNP